MNRRAPLHQRCALPLSFLSYCMWLNAIFLFFSTHLPPDIVFSHPRHRKVMILPTLLFILSSFNPHLLFILFIISPASCDTNQFHHSWFPPKAKADLLYKHPPPYLYTVKIIKITMFLWTKDIILPCPSPKATSRPLLEIFQPCFADGRRRTYRLNPRDLNLI